MIKKQFLWLGLVGALLGSVSCGVRADEPSKVAAFPFEKLPGQNILQAYAKDKLKTFSLENSAEVRLNGQVIIIAPNRPPQLTTNSVHDTETITMIADLLGGLNDEQQSSLTNHQRLLWRDLSDAQKKDLETYFRLMVGTIEGEFLDYSQAQFKRLRASETGQFRIYIKPAIGISATDKDLGFVSLAATPRFRSLGEGAIFDIESKTFQKLDFVPAGAPEFKITIPESKVYALREIGEILVQAGVKIRVSPLAEDRTIYLTQGQWTQEDLIPALLLTLGVELRAINKQYYLGPSREFMIRKVYAEITGRRKNEVATIASAFGPYMKSNEFVNRVKPFAPATFQSLEPLDYQKLTQAQQVFLKTAMGDKAALLNEAVLRPMLVCYVGLAENDAQEKPDPTFFHYVVPPLSSTAQE